MSTIIVQATDIPIGEHVERHFLGMTFNLDTIWTTGVAGAVVLVLGFWARHQLTKDADNHVPSKLQIMWEAVIDQVQVQVEDNLGKANRTVVMLAVAGASDTVSAVYRSTMLQVATPPTMQGRLQGVFIVVVNGGPRLDAFNPQRGPLER